MILGDLYVLEAGLKVIMKVGRWPDRLDLQAMIATWRGVREPFASGVAAWEWALIDGIFSNLHRVSLMVHLGEPFSEETTMCWPSCWPYSSRPGRGLDARDG